jgi:hypothetical protein
VTKPKPFSSLNHFTVPVAISDTSTACVLRTWRMLESNDNERWHLIAEQQLGSNTDHGSTGDPIR